MPTASIAKTKSVRKGVSKRVRKPASGYKLVRDPVTGLTITQGPARAPKVSSEQIKNLLANFP